LFYIIVRIRVKLIMNFWRRKSIFRVCNVECFRIDVKFDENVWIMKEQFLWQYYF